MHDFDSAQMKQAYELAIAKHALSRLRYSALYAIFFTALFVLLDYFYVPRYIFVTFIYIRLFIVVVCIPYLICSHYFPDFALRTVKLLNGSIFFIASACLVLMTQLLEGGASPYYAGLCLVILVIGQLVPFTTREGIVVCLSIVLFYIFITIFLHNIQDLSIFILNIFFMGATMFLTITNM